LELNPTRTQRRQLTELLWFDYQSFSFFDSVFCVEKRSLVAIAVTAEIKNIMPSKSMMPLKEKRFSYTINQVPVNIKTIAEAFRRIVSLFAFS
jgi:hypothetical protein